MRCHPWKYKRNQLERSPELSLKHLFLPCIVEAGVTFSSSSLTRDKCSAQATCNLHSSVFIEICPLLAQPLAMHLIGGWGSPKESRRQDNPQGAIVLFVISLPSHNTNGIVILFKTHQWQPVRAHSPHTFSHVWWTSEYYDIKVSIWIKLILDKNNEFNDLPTNLCCIALLLPELLCSNFP